MNESVCGCWMGTRDFVCVIVTALELKNFFSLLQQWRNAFKVMFQHFTRFVKLFLWVVFFSVIKIPLSANRALNHIWSVDLIENINRHMYNRTNTKTSLFFSRIETVIDLKLWAQSAEWLSYPQTRLSPQKGCGLDCSGSSSKQADKAEVIKMYFVLFWRLISTFMSCLKFCIRYFNVPDRLICLSLGNCSYKSKKYEYMIIWSFKIAKDVWTLILMPLRDILYTFKAKLVSLLNPIETLT